MSTHTHVWQQFLTVLWADQINSFTVTDVRGQDALTLSSEILQESDNSDTAYSSVYVSDVQSLIAKSTFQQFFG